MNEQLELSLEVPGTDRARYMTLGFGREPGCYNCRCGQAHPSGHKCAVAASKPRKTIDPGLAFGQSWAQHPGNTVEKMRRQRF